MRKCGLHLAALKVALSKMEGVRHWPDRSKPYSVMESELAKWLVGNADAVQIMCDKARDTGTIVYDNESGCWYGVETEVGRRLRARGEEEGDGER